MSGALSGLKILDFTALWPGPLATSLLADLGAEVLRVDAPDRSDLLRYLGPFDQDGEGAAYRAVNRNKRSLLLNLKAEGAAEVVQRLVAQYDIVVEQFRPGVLDRLGVGYDALKLLNPRLIWCSITSFGQTGPYRDRPGHDIDFVALSGIASHTWADRRKALRIQGFCSATSAVARSAR
jgi:alpha-methylacyl-CoA racemase